MPLVNNDTDDVLNLGYRAHFAKHGFSIYSDNVAAAHIGRTAAQNEIDLLQLLAKIHRLRENRALNHDGDTQINLRVAEDTLIELLNSFNDTNIPPARVKPARDLSKQEAKTELELIAIRKKAQEFVLNRPLQRMRVADIEREMQIFFAHPELQPRQSLTRP